MISETTIKLLDFMIRISGDCYVMPLHFNKNTCRVSEVRNDAPFSITMWRLIFSCCVVVEVVLIIFSFFVLLTDPLPPMHEIVVQACFAFLLFLCMVVFHHSLTRIHDVVLMLNRFIVFDETFRKSVYRNSKPDNS